jgi:hypothetical protein
MSTREDRINEYLDERDESALFADGFGEAIIGLGGQFNKGPFVVYDQQKVLEILMERDGMTAEEAEEFFDFNVAGAWVGEQTPVFVVRFDEDDED